MKKYSLIISIILVLMLAMTACAAAPSGGGTEAQSGQAGAQPSAPAPAGNQPDYNYTYNGPSYNNYYGPLTVVNDAPGASAGTGAANTAPSSTPQQDTATAAAPSPSAPSPSVTVPVPAEPQYTPPAAPQRSGLRKLLDILWPWGRLFARPAPPPPVYEPPVYTYEDKTTYGDYPRWGDTAPMTEQERTAANERYQQIIEANRVYTSENPAATLSLKASTASYTNAQRFLESGTLPPQDAVRTEELINYFSYDERPEFIPNSPFAIRTEMGPSPFDKNKAMAYVRLRTKDVASEQSLPPSNLVFLIDVSGSMDEYDKLPLLQDAFSMLTDSLDAEDTVSIVVYASSSGVVLDGVSGANKNELKNAIYSLRAGGSTAGQGGIQLAYSVAQDRFIKGGNNRVILATDGDFNVGISDTDSLQQFISEKRDTGVYLSVLGFGTGNLRDDMMETLANNGNGNYSYIDSLDTAQKVLVNELTGTLFTVANDVKAQAVFDPRLVKSYRMIGYENSMLSNSDFTNDAVDAGEVGLGTDVNMLFELDLTDRGWSVVQDGGSVYDIKIRYKDPGQPSSKEIGAAGAGLSVRGGNSTDFGFACAVALYGDFLRHPEQINRAGMSDLRGRAQANIGRDSAGYREGFLRLVDTMNGVWKESRYYY